MCGDCFVCIYLVCQCDGLELGRRNRRITVRGVAVRINTGLTTVVKIKAYKKNVTKKIWGLSLNSQHQEHLSRIQYQKEEYQC